MHSLEPSNNPSDMLTFTIRPPPAACRASTELYISWFNWFWLIAASTASDGDSGGGGGVGGGGKGGGGDGETATAESGAVTSVMFSPSRVESESIELLFKLLKVFDAVCGDVVLIVNVIVLPAKRRERCTPIKLRRAPVSLS